MTNNKEREFESYKIAADIFSHYEKHLRNDTAEYRQITIRKPELLKTLISNAITVAYAKGRQSVLSRVPSEDEVVQAYQKKAIECCNQCEITAHEETRVVAVKHAHKIILSKLSDDKSG